MNDNSSVIQNFNCRNNKDKMEEKLPLNQNILRVKTESGLEEIYYPVFYEGLPEEYKILAEQELGETATEKERCLAKLKEFMKKENLSATDDLLITVLRGCKYNLEKSGPKLKIFLRFRQVIIEKLRRIDEKNMELILSDTVLTVLPYRDKHGRAIAITQPTISFDKYSMDDCLTVLTCLCLYLLTFPMTNVCGVAYVADANCESLFILRVGKSLKTGIHYWRSSPMRIARTDVVNESFVLRNFYKALTPLLPEKFKNRLRFHGNSYESLHEIYHPDILPQEFGGNLGPMSDEFYRERMMTFMRTLREEAIQD